MAEPRIQYARTEDGVSIAYWKMGEGKPPLIQMPPAPWSHVQLELEVPGWRAWDERLSETHTHVRYDHRGSGLSSRNVTEISLETLVLDLEAVVDRIALEKVAIFGHHSGGGAALAYAVKHPERVSHLILWCSLARTGPGGLDENTRFRTLRSLRREDWETYTETLAHTVFGWSQGEEAHRFARFMRECTTPDVAQAYFGVEFDLRDVLAKVLCPVLVVQPRSYPIMPVENAQELCAGIPDAQLTLLEGTTGVTYMEDMEALATVIDDFLREAKPAAASESSLPSGMTAILFADIVDSTALTERLGDTAFRERARDLDTSLRSIIRDSGGTPIEGKLLGDGVLATFTSARQAIEAVLRCGSAGDECGLPLHLGLHAGDVIREEDPDGRSNVYGGAVNIAARIAAESAPGEVLVSQTVRDLARTSAGVGFENAGERELKGVGEPVRVWAVRERA